MLYMDCDERMLFGGIINRPVMNPSREFVLKHTDKCEAFLKEFRSHVESKKFGERLKNLPNILKPMGGVNKTETDIYQIIDLEIT